MNNLEALTLFVALRLHFTTEAYDYFRFNGKVKYKLHDISKRKDKLQIAKLAKHSNPIGLLVSNFSINSNIRWLGDVFTEKANQTYKDYVKRIESLTYTFKEELKKFHPKFADNFIVPKNSHPYALRLFLGEHISLETLVMINESTNFHAYWDNEMHDDIVWQQVHLQIPKYRPFLQFDPAAVRHNMVAYFQDK